MNKKATKLLYKYASISDRDIKSLKKWWNSLSWEEKTRERKRIEEELGTNETEEEESEEPEK